MSRFHERFIPEIQGLRAIAVVAVVVYHLWPWLVPGGYVGVDVFFVISGYLITGSLLKELEATRRIDVFSFYARRIRRLLPAATLVSLAVAGSIPLFPRTQWPDIASSLLASALYVQNWFLAAQSVDYLADDAKGPMNHFWSLSVEEQYYLIWPLLLWLLIILAKKPTLNLRAAVGWLVGLIGIGSLTYSVYLTHEDAGVAYFATTTRAWELALGGALALFGRHDVLPTRWRAALAPIGFGAIVLACLIYTENTHFPGYAALLPTLGAAAVIMTSGAQGAWPVGRLLSSPPFQYLGDISYSLYLWHWPLIVVYSEVRGHAPGLLAGALLFLTSCALAHLSKVWVEDPFRLKRLALRPTLAAGAASVALTALVGGGVLAWESGSLGSAPAAERPRGAMAMLDPAYDWKQEDLSKVVPPLTRARQDVPSAYAAKCHQDQSGTEALTCDYGDPKSGYKVVLLGDSHATHWFPAFEEIARQRPIYFRGVAKSACLFSLETVYNSKLKRPYTECLEWSRNVMKWLAKERPDLVLISQSPGYPRKATKGMIAAWKHLTELGLNVRPILSIPWMPFESDKCLANAKDWTAECAPSRSKVFKPDHTLRAAEFLKLRTMDFAELFCRGSTCPAVIGGVLVYRDSHHMTATFARTLSPLMMGQLELPMEERD